MEGQLFEKRLARYAEDLRKGSVSYSDVAEKFCSGEENAQLTEDYQLFFSTISREDAENYIREAVKYMEKISPENIVTAQQIISVEEKDYERTEEDRRILAAKLYVGGTLHPYLTLIDRLRYSVLDPDFIQRNLFTPKLLTKVADGKIYVERLKDEKLFGGLEEIKELISLLPDKIGQGSDYENLRELIEALPEKVAEEVLQYQENLSRLKGKLDELREKLSRGAGQQDNDDLESRLVDLIAKDVQSQQRIGKLEIQVSNLEAQLREAEERRREVEASRTITVWAEPETIYSGWVRIGNELYYGSDLIPINRAPLTRIRELARAEGIKVSGRKADVIERVHEYFNQADSS